MLPRTVGNVKAFLRLSVVIEIVCVLFKGLSSFGDHRVVKQKLSVMYADSSKSSKEFCSIQVMPHLFCAGEQRYDASAFGYFISM